MLLKLLTSTYQNVRIMLSVGENALAEFKLVGGGCICFSLVYLFIYYLFIYLFKVNYATE